MRRHFVTLSLSRLLMIVFIAGLMAGCSKKEEPAALPRISPGAPRHIDVGDFALKYPLPADVADGFLQFSEAPGFSYGLMMAHDKLSQRSHERSDMLAYIHNGMARFHVGEKDFYVTIGDVVYIPRGAIYSVVNRGQSELQFFSMYSPPLDPDDVVYYDKDEESDKDETQ